MRRPALLCVLLLAALAGCWVPDVDVAGKAADRDHPCEEGYTAEAVPDGGFVCVPQNGS